MREFLFSVWKNYLRDIDWLLVISAISISILGLLTMNSFIGNNSLFDRQLLWLVISILVMCFFSFIDFRFLRRTPVVVFLFAGICVVLLSLFIIGSTVKGTQGWIDFGSFSFQPSDPAKLVLIIVLAKYFTRRHVEIAHIRHILVPGFYAFVLFALVFLQPDFGSAIIIFGIWFGMMMVTGISRRHLMVLMTIGIIAFASLWLFVFAEYQKQRILTFINPLSDLQGAGYNAYQSTVAVGSGQLLGKGIGYGTQSKLSFLPEFETDFIFAAFAEEWGFIGVIILFILFGILIWRIIANAQVGSTNFEILYCVGLSLIFMTHFIIHVGMNIGLLPVTGITIPFMSYGGSHLLTEFAGIGILLGMRRYRRAAHKDLMKNEFLGI